MRYLKQIFVFLTLLTLLYLANCCGDVTDDPPEELLKNNEFVFLAELISCDTLIELGSISYLGDMEDYHIVECALMAIDDIKSKNINDIYYLWICQYTRQKDGYSNIPKFHRKDSILIFGNSIKNDNEIVNLYAPNIIGKNELIAVISQNNPINKKWMTKTEDSLLILKIKASNELRRILKERRTSGQVIYCTQYGFATINSYLYDDIEYCDKIWIPHFMSGKAYVRKLKAAAKSL